MMADAMCRIDSLNNILKTQDNTAVITMYAYLP